MTARPRRSGAAPSADVAAGPRAATALAAGIVAASTAATLVRLAQGEGMPSLVIAAGRLVVATAVLAPIVLARHRRDLGGLGRREWTLLLLGGLTLAVHFAAWISALEYTSVIAGVVLGSTSPVFVAVLSIPLLGERVRRAVVAGILLTVAGGVLVALSGPGEPPTRPAPLLGNALALAAALAFALYLLVGRRVRPRLPLVPYVAVVYGVAAVILAATALLGGERLTGHSGTGWLWVLAIGLVPQLIGHSGFNYALAHLPAAIVGLVSRLEPVGSTVCAAVVLGELPGALAIAGAAVTIAGVALPGWPGRRPAGGRRAAAP